MATICGTGRPSGGSSWAFAGEKRRKGEKVRRRMRRGRRRFMGDPGIGDWVLGIGDWRLEIGLKVAG
jgi:hypothetical protein